MKRELLQRFVNLEWKFIILILIPIYMFIISILDLKEEGTTVLGKVLHSSDKTDHKHNLNPDKEEAIHDIEKVYIFISLVVLVLFVNSDSNDQF